MTPNPTMHRTRCQRARAHRHGPVISSVRATLCVTRTAPRLSLVGR